MAACSNEIRVERLNQILEAHHDNFGNLETVGRQAADLIVTLLLRHPSLRISRYIVGSIFGKRKTIQGDSVRPASDLYVFFNLNDYSDAGIQKAFPCLLNFVSAIFKHQNLVFTAINDFLLQVQIILPATVVSVDVHFAADFKGGASFQWREVLRRCFFADSNLPFLQASAVEKLQEFFNSQNQFTKTVVTLARIWNDNTIELQPTQQQYMQGRHMIVELVAVKAAWDEKQTTGAGNPRLGAAMKRFFNYLKQDCSTLKILFGQMHLPFDTVGTYKEQSQKAAILMDPVIPYVDYLEGTNVKISWSQLQNPAQLSSDHWERLQLTGDKYFADRMLTM